MFWFNDILTVPGSVSSMLITSIQTTSATISWSIPDYVPASYPIITYEVGYYTTSDSCTCASSVDVVSELVSAVMNTTSLTSTINNLMSGTSYVFVVRGYTEVGPGPWRGVVGQIPVTITTTIVATPTDESCSIGTCVQ